MKTKIFLSIILLLIFLTSSFSFCQHQIGIITLYSNEWHLKNYEPDTIFYIHVRNNDLESNNSYKVYFKFDLGNETEGNNYIAVIAKLYKSGDTTVLQHILLGKDINNLSGKIFWASIDIPTGDNYLISIYDLDEWLLCKSKLFSIKK